MSDIIDISVRLHPDMATWPGSPGLRLHSTRAIGRGDGVTESRLDMDVHCGTHVEGPMHFIDGGSPVSAIPLDVLVGPAHVEHITDADDIGPRELEGVPAGVERLLLRTRNSDERRPGAAFSPDYVALTLEGARWVADRGIRLVGVDYLSVQRFADDPETHRVLMRAGVAILENIDLARVKAGAYRLTCLPLALDDAEAAPARAILEPLP